MTARDRLVNRNCLSGEMLPNRTCVPYHLKPRDSRSPGRARSHRTRQPYGKLGKGGFPPEV